MTNDLVSLHAMLAHRCRAPAWALLREVPDATGARKRRSADALAISLWPSRGLHIHGFEMKVSRSDWLRELQAPEKSASIQRYCHFWWIVATPGVVRGEELPPTWGLLIPRGKGLVAHTPAPELQPDPVTLDFVAALGRRMNESVAVATRLAREQLDGDDDFQRGYSEGKLDGERGAGTGMKRAQRDLADLQREVAAFEEASGVKIDAYNGTHIGKLFAVAQALDVVERQRMLRFQLDRAGELLAAAKQALENLQQ